MGGLKEGDYSVGGTVDESVFWRVEGSLLNLTAVRPVAFFTWNAQSFAGRWIRRTGVAVSAVIRPLLYATNRVFATRMLHLLLRGVSQDRLDLLGEEYFEYVLKPRLKPEGMAKLRELQTEGRRIVLVSQGLDHVMRPLARYLGVNFLVANRLEFRDGLATGRLLDPVIRRAVGSLVSAGKEPMAAFPCSSLRQIWDSGTDRTSFSMRLFPPSGRGKDEIPPLSFSMGKSTTVISRCVGPSQGNRFSSSG